MNFQNGAGSVEAAKGKRLDEVIAVCGSVRDIPLALYLLVRIGGKWCRLMLDEGVLFLDSTHAPHAGRHEDETDVLRTVELPRAEILSFVVRDAEVQIVLAGGTTLVVSEDPATSLIATFVVHSG